jgi:hypothetical protein
LFSTFFPNAHAHSFSELMDSVTVLEENLRTQLPKLNTLLKERLRE